MSIYSDSHSCQEAIQNRSNSSSLIASIHTRLFSLRRRFSINFFWVKAHVGIYGNELADQFAKNAAEQCSELSYNICSISFVKHSIKTQTMLVWQRQYSEAITGSETKKHFKTIEEAKIYREKIGISFELTQILTGHGFNKSYLYRFKIIDNEVCPCDSRSPQTMDHLLQHCSRFDRQRMIFVTLCESYRVTPWHL